MTGSNQNSLPLVIHVGFPKTATTTLQNHLFSTHSQILYLGKPYADPRLEEAIHHLMMTDTIDYSPGSQGLRNQGLNLAEFIPQQLKEHSSSEGGEKRVAVLSDELFLSFSKVRDKGVVAQRIREQLQPQKIIITIRNQLSLLKSAYLGRGRLLLGVPPRFSGQFVSFGQWLTMCKESIHGNYIRQIDYYKTISYYAGLFGKDNVHVLLMEELARDSGAFLRSLSGLLGIDGQELSTRMKDAHDNRALSRARFESEKLSSRFFPFHRFPPVSMAIKLISFIKNKRFKDSPARVDFPSGWRDELETLYSKGNRGLAEEFALPLEKYGYPM